MTPLRVNQARNIATLLHSLQMEIAAIWREPFEHYDLVHWQQWDRRLEDAQAAYDAVLEEYLSENPTEARRR